MQKPQDLNDNRFLIFSSPDIGIELEYSENVVAMHFKYFVRMTPKTFREIDRMLTGLIPFLQMNGYQGLFAALDKEFIKNKKLASMLGFKYIGFEKGVDIYIKEF